MLRGNVCCQYPHNPATEGQHYTANVAVNFAQLRRLQTRCAALPGRTWSLPTFAVMRHSGHLSRYVRFAYLV